VLVGCLAATWLIWGSTYLAIRWALVSLPPFFQMGTRFVAAALVLGAIAAVRGASWPTAGEWASAVVLGALMIGGGYGATALAEVSVGSGLTVAFIAVVPALVALGESVYGVRTSRRQAAGIALGLIGVLILTRGQGFSASPQGLAAITFATVTWTLGTLWARHGLPGGRRLNLAEGPAGHASHMLLGGLMLLGAAWWSDERPALPPDSRSALAWLYLVLPGTLVAYSAYLVLLRRTSALLASSFTFVNPIIGLLLGVTLGSEVVTLQEWLASGVIALAVLLLLTGSR
jgi:drug/metabolite transporter (DMT)-like permease